MICRPTVLLSLILFFSPLWALRAQSPKPNFLQEALALEQAMQKAIRDAEPAVGCVLVSRSDVYRRWFGEAGPREYSGKLGAFDPDQAHFRRIPPEDQFQVDEMRRELRRKLPNRSPSDSIEREIKRRYDLADPSTAPESFGSGVVVGETPDRRLLLLTNYHVVRDATKVYVRLAGEKGSYADIHAADPRSDLAVLRLIDNVDQVKPIRMGDGGRVSKGQWVISIAHPYASGFRDGSPSASWGILSNIRRRPASNAVHEYEPARMLHEYGTLLQTDARINLGVSGGVLVNLQGEMIGLTTALAAIQGSEISGGFAVPMDQRMKRIVGVLIQGREVEYGFLGVSLSEARKSNGILITGVTPGSPAARANVFPNDRIVAINGTQVRENDDLFLNVGTSLAGSEVTLELERGSEMNRIHRPMQVGLRRTVQTVLAKFYVPTKGIASNRPSLRGLHVDYTSVAIQQARFMGGSIPEGVVISEVEPGSAAARAGLKPSEIILAVQGQPVNSPAEFFEQGRKSGRLELTLASSDSLKPPLKVTLD